MATEKRLIDAHDLWSDIMMLPHNGDIISSEEVEQAIKDAPTVDAYTAHEVAEILADVYGDTCACNFNGNDEWLPEKCELLDVCPNTVGVACWEQFLKYRGDKDGL